MYYLFSSLFTGVNYVLIVFACFFVFFFKQKTSYEISACLVCSEIFIRDSYYTFLTAYQTLFPRTMKPACCRAVRYLLATNILWGDALTLQTPDDSARPIVFAEWSDIGGGRFKRRDFMLANLLQSQPMEGPNLFSDLGDAAFIPTPVAEYPLVHYLKLGADEEL